MQMTPALSTLSALRSLELTGARICFQPGASLPPTITRLAVHLNNEPHVLKQARRGWVLSVG